MNKDLWRYPATMLKIVDGDTVDVRVDLGLHVATTVRVRLAGIDTPERFSPAGKAATSALAAALPVGAPVTVRFDGRDKYGRWLAVEFHRGDLDVPAWLVGSGMAVKRAG